MTRRDKARLAVAKRVAARLGSRPGGDNDRKHVKACLHTFCQLHADPGCQLIDLPVKAK